MKCKEELNIKFITAEELYKLKKARIKAFYKDKEK